MYVQKQRANVYMMMLILAFLEIVVGCVFLYMEMNTYQFKVKVPQDAKMQSVPEPPVQQPTGYYQLGELPHVV